MSEAKPEQSKRLKVEMRGIEPVPPSERYGKPWTLATLWFGGNVQFASLVTGALSTAIFGLSFWQAFAAMSLGIVVGSVVLAILAGGGPRTGAAQLVQSRRGMGYLGNFAPGALSFFQGVSWFAVNSVFAAFALDYLTGMSFGVSLLVLCVVQIGVAVYGHDLIHATERWLMVLLLLVFAAVAIYSFAKADYGAGFNAQTAGVSGFSGAFILSAAVSSSRTFSWATGASDYTRYLPETTSRKTVFKYAFIGPVVGGIWLQSVGAALGTIHFFGTPTDMVTDLLPTALGIVVMIAIVLAAISANVLDIYSGAMAALVTGIRLQRWQAALIVGALGTLVGWLAGQGNFYASFQSFLFLIGYWIAPWMAVMLLDNLKYARNSRSTAQMFDRGYRFGPGFWAVVVGIAVSVPFMRQEDLFVGPFAAAHPGWGDSSYIVGFIVSLALYPLLRRGVGTTETEEDVPVVMAGKNDVMD